MSTKNPKSIRIGLTSVAVSAKLQIAFLIAIGLAILAQLFMVLTTMYYQNEMPGNIVPLGLQMVDSLYPIIILAASLVFTWRRYNALLHRMFVASLLTITVQTVIGVFFSLFSFLRVNFNWFVSDNSMSGLPSRYFDSLFIITGLCVYVLILAYLSWGKRAK